MTEVQIIEQGPEGSYGDAVASGGYTAEGGGRTVTGYDHPSVFVEAADPRATDYSEMTKDDLHALIASRNLEPQAKRRTHDELVAVLVEADQAAGVQTQQQAADLDTMTREQLVAEADALGVEHDTLDDDELRDAIEDEREAH